MSKSFNFRGLVNRVEKTLSEMKKETQNRGRALSSTLSTPDLSNQDHSDSPAGLQLLLHYKNAFALLVQNNDRIFSLCDRVNGRVLQTTEKCQQMRKDFVNIRDEINKSDLIVNEIDEIKTHLDFVLARTLELEKLVTAKTEILATEKMEQWKMQKNKELEKVRNDKETEYVVLEAKYRLSKQNKDNMNSSDSDDNNIKYQKALDNAFQKDLENYELYGPPSTSTSTSHDEKIEDIVIENDEKALDDFFEQEQNDVGDDEEES